MIYKKFHSQFGEDRWLVENVKLPRKGFFVDVGAGRAQYFSNTFHFERNGWDGLCIEPDPRALFSLLEGRTCQIAPFAVTNKDGEMVTLNLTNSSDISTLINTQDIPRYDNAIKVAGFRLETIFKKYGVKKIDLLSIDVEGFEIEVLRSFDILKWKPEIMIIEFKSVVGENRSGEIFHYLKNVPVHKIHTTQSNLIYKWVR